MLRQRIDDEGLKLGYIADQLGLSYSGLQNKTQGRTEFTASEVARLQDILHLSAEERDMIFFD